MSFVIVIASYPLALLPRRRNTPTDVDCHRGPASCIPPTVQQCNSSPCMFPVLSTTLLSEAMKKENRRTQRSRKRDVSVDVSGPPVRECRSRDSSSCVSHRLWRWSVHRRLFKTKNTLHSLFTFVDVSSASLSVPISQKSVPHFRCGNMPLWTWYGVRFAAHFVCVRQRTSL